MCINSRQLLFIGIGPKKQGLINIRIDLRKIHNAHPEQKETISKTIFLFVENT